MYVQKQWQTDSHHPFYYVEYLPKDYDPAKEYPLVLFLHGAGERVQDPHQAMFHGYMKYVREQGKEYPFIFIAPQCIGNAYWGSYTESLSAFLDYVLETYPVDRRRVYLTGLSMGGTGTWMFAMARPNTFAAIMPVCGSGIYWNVANLLKTPIYMVHGDCDTCVPISNSVEMLTSINSRGGNAKLKICYGVGHDAWNYAYTDDSLLEWMLSQRLPE
ncbi:MAG: prolyl oligopeptidase family serine peptidase [Clostridia bacterium]|nr:prolyl oligopeptidase family serine peptidase [Clostridia bacterium]MBO7157802.1 prolyl oligopeptidase family serine peptidase [Clostridia bacterium]